MNVLFFVLSSEKPSILTVDHYCVRKELATGDWCIISENDEKMGKKLLIGLVLGFTYLDGETFKAREFSKSNASVSSNSNRGIGVLCSLYTYNACGVLTNVPDHKHKFISTESYIGTIKSPNYVDKLLKLSDNLVAELDKLTNMC